MTELLIRGGTVYGPDGPAETDVRVTDGVITGVEAGAAAPGGATVIDARGMYVMPGAIDVHVHSRDPGFPEKEDFGTLTAAAAIGGVTTVIDMPNTVPAVDAAGVLEAKAALARPKARVDFGLWALVRSSSTEDQLEALAAAGAVGFKAYLGYSFSMSGKQVLQRFDADDPDLEAPPDYGTLARLAPAMARLGLPLAIHAEDPAVLAAFRRPLETYADLLESRPAEAEAVAISAAAAIARDCGVSLHVAHLSSALGLRAAQDAMSTGTRLTLETCPQYLWISDKDFERLGTAMKVFPPVRTAADREALVEAAANGVIRIVATDHAPHTDEEKARSFEQAPSGSPGVQQLYLSCLALASRLGDVSLAPRWVSEGPAALAGLQQTKGAIAPGFDADLVIVDPNRTTLIRPALMRSRQRRGVFDGMDFRFGIRDVFLRGRSIVRDGKLTGRPSGRMVRPAR
ncbi:MAG TPA: dihydroorotase family protein [Candidatus Acidoferrum sp.]|nr:dihydroorotase family protein [Candidatus Acidoferrum sp.]